MNNTGNNFKLEILDKELVANINNEQFIIKSERYNFIKKLGSGAFGLVAKVKNNFTGELSALKVQYLKSPSFRKVFTDEVYVLRELHEICDTFICIKDSGILNDELFLAYIEMELIERKELKDYYKEDMSDNKKYTEEHILFIGLQILKGIHIIHSNSFAHMDIKPANIMIDPQSLQIKIVDVGLLCYNELCGPGGTPRYMLKKYSEYNSLKERQLSDIYAFIVTMMELLFRDYSWAHEIIFEDKQVREKNDILTLLSVVIEDKFFLDFFENLMDIGNDTNNLLNNELSIITQLVKYFYNNFKKYNIKFPEKLIIG